MDKTFFNKKEVLYQPVYNKNLKSINLINIHNSVSGSLDGFDRPNQEPTSSLAATVEQGGGSAHLKQTTRISFQNLTNYNPMRGQDGKDVGTSELINSKNQAKKSNLKIKKETFKKWYNISNYIRQIRYNKISMIITFAKRYITTAT